MLQELRVHNLALIDTLHLDLAARSTGLIVLTGETGAGKSIILQAINLLTGGRGTAALVRGDCEQASIEAVFSVRPDHTEMQALLTEHTLVDGGGCLIRRVLTREGRSRLYINDQSVTTRLAGELTAHLINVASQHDHQMLLQARSHIDYLDTYGDLWELRRQFGGLFRRWRDASAELRQLEGREQDKERQRDFLGYQLQEIRKAKVVAGEDEQLQQERDRLKASDGLMRAMGAASRQMGERVMPAMAEIKKQVDQAAALDPTLGLLAERIGSARFELEDLAGQVERYLDEIPSDPSRLETIAARLAELKQLQRKYGATLEEVIEFARVAAESLAQLDSLDEQIALAGRRVEQAAAEMLHLAGELSQERRQAAKRLGRSMEQELASLSFPQAVFEVAIAEPEQQGTEGIQASGRDTVEFLFSANPGEPPRPLARIASGGELSRLMLAMKCLLARRDQVDTVIFDEIDAGIGGQAASAVAAKISELAGHHQVFCITHLPQIAACADLHFRVEKQVEHGRTRTLIIPLDRDQRVGELARMLGGERPSPQTLAYAEELIARKAGRAAV